MSVILFLFLKISLYVRNKIKFINIPQVYVGHRPVDNRNVTNVEEANFSVGDFVAIFQRELYDRVRQRIPIIGKIVSVMEDDGRTWVEIELWQGSFSGKWTSGPRNTVTEWLTKEAIIMYDFKFTDKGRLHGPTKLKLKELYAKYIHNDDSTEMDIAEN